MSFLGYEIPEKEEKEKAELGYMSCVWILETSNQCYNLYIGISEWMGAIMGTK